MAKTTHTHKGHCQACGRIQAAANGSNTIAKHGYVVAGFGFFNGTCQGSDAPALELSREACDAICVQLYKRAAEDDAHAKALRAGTVHPLTVQTDTRAKDAEGRPVRDERGHIVYVVLAWANASEYQRSVAVNRAIAHCVQDAAQCRSHAKMLQTLAANVHGQPLRQNADLTRPAPVQIAPGLRFTRTDGVTVEVVSLVNFGGRAPRATVKWTKGDASGTWKYVTLQSLRSEYNKANKGA